MKKSVSFLVPVVTLSLIIAVTMAACSKSGNGSKPKISLESVTSIVEPDGELDIKLKFTNGDKLSGGSYWVERTRINQIPPQNAISGDTVTYSIPDYNNVQQGELEYAQPYQGYLHFDDHINDTLVFRIAVITSTGISSDTLTTPKIVSISP
jgi:hypothetical protein